MGVILGVYENNGANNGPSFVRPLTIILVVSGVEGREVGLVVVNEHSRKKRVKPWGKSVVPEKIAAGLCKRSLDLMRRGGLAVRRNVVSPKFRFGGWRRRPKVVVIFPLFRELRRRRTSAY